MAGVRQGLLKNDDMNALASRLNMTFVVKSGFQPKVAREPWGFKIVPVSKGSLGARDHGRIALLKDVGQFVGHERKIVAALAWPQPNVFAVGIGFRVQIRSHGPRRRAAVNPNAFQIRTEDGLDSGANMGIQGLAGIRGTPPCRGHEWRIAGSQGLGLDRGEFLFLAVAFGANPRARRTCCASALDPSGRNMQSGGGFLSWRGCHPLGHFIRFALEFVSRLVDGQLRLKQRDMGLLFFGKRFGLPLYGTVAGRIVPPLALEKAGHALIRNRPRRMT
jgi:hypothetical protein